MSTQYSLRQRLFDRAPKYGFWRYAMPGLDTPTALPASAYVVCHDCTYMMIGSGMVRKPIMYEHGRRCRFCDKVCDYRTKKTLFEKLAKFLNRLVRFSV